MFCDTGFGELRSSTSSIARIASSFVHARACGSYGVRTQACDVSAQLAKVLLDALQFTREV
jgi:hypothetical protein